MKTLSEHNKEVDELRGGRYETIWNDLALPSGVLCDECGTEMAQWPMTAPNDWWVDVRCPVCKCVHQKELFNWTF